MLIFNPAHNSDNTCMYCNIPSAKIIRYSNFKHYWFRCVSCGTMWRKNKNKLPGERFLSVIEKIPIVSKIARRIFPSYLKRQDFEMHMYETYGKAFYRIMDATPGDEIFEVKRKRYLNEANELIQLFSKNKIDISQKVLLDVSGGPGTFAYFIKDKVGSITVTEYGHQTVAAMKEYLSGIKLMQADINEPWPGNHKYDVVLYRSCLYFCFDFRKHLKDIKKNLTPGALVYICTTAPSLGNSLRWQFEDYTHNVLYSETVVFEILKTEGFSIIENGITDFYTHFLNHYTFRDRIFHRWGIWNVFKKNAPKGLDARAFWVLAKKN